MPTTANPNSAMQTQGLNAPAQTPAAPQTQTPAPPMANPNAAWQNSVQAPPSTVVNVNTPPQSQNSAPGATQNQNSSPAQPPSASLQAGAQGEDVQNLQKYLIQQGYLTPEQVATGPGTYGPQTTAAVAKLQQDLGLQQANGAFGPQTQAALAQKYQGMHAAMQGTTAPDQGSQARAAIQTLAEQSSNSQNPALGAITGAMQPIMQSLTQVLANINNPALTAVSLQQEYNDLRSKSGLPAMQSQMLNMQRIMNGTIDDIRDEVTSAGGFATESQIQGMATARNKTILKQYNSLSTQYDAAQTNIQATMQYAQSDTSNAMQRQQLTATVTGTLASIQNQMLTMGMTMQNNARQAVQYNVTQMGYKGLATASAGNPAMLGYYENMLGLAPGTLSDPASVQSMDTYKDQQLQLNNYKSLIQAYNAGFTGPAPASFPTAGGQYGTATSTVSQILNVDPNTSLAQVEPGLLAAAIIKNEGSSPQGVVNNPGNIKFVGLPGQTNSGVKATDGGTFANYATPQAGQQAIEANIASAAKRDPNATLGSFIDRYTNTAPTQPTTPVGQIGQTPVDPATLSRPAWVGTAIPLTMTADGMTSYMNTQKAAHNDPGTNNIVAPGIGYYVQQSDGSYVLKSALPSGTDTQYQQYKQTMDNAPIFKGSPAITRKWTLSANSAISSFKDTGTYKVASNVAPYLAAIHAAAQNPGDKSISDFELLDSFVKAAKGGVGQVTDSQINVMLKGASLGDRYDVFQQRLQQGGVMSPAQRTALVTLADSTYKENMTEYKKGYVQALTAMHDQGIPAQFWRNLPDFSQLTQ